MTRVTARLGALLHSHRPYDVGVYLPGDKAQIPGPVPCEIAVDELLRM